jgi:hypothetical protein
MLRQQPNGDVLFDNVTEIPKAGLEGYTQDENNPLHFVIDLEPCRFRNTLNLRMPCGKIIYALNCQLFNKQVCPAFCDSCLQGEP